jgi:hypothetical protein
MKKEPAVDPALVIPTKEDPAFDPALVIPNPRISRVRNLLLLLTLRSEV